MTNNNNNALAFSDVVGVFSDSVERGGEEREIKVL